MLALRGEEIRKREERERAVWEECEEAAAVNTNAGVAIQEGGHTTLVKQWTKVVCREAPAVKPSNWI
jgi:CRISPR/Cas system-associated protein Cas10 (large subunit of type III CRISPR-Cas system)